MSVWKPSSRCIHVCNQLSPLQSARYLLGGSSTSIMRWHLFPRHAAWEASTHAQQPAAMLSKSSDEEDRAASIEKADLARNYRKTWTEQKMTGSLGNVFSASPVWCFPFGSSALSLPSDRRETLNGPVKTSKQMVDTMKDAKSYSTVIIGSRRFYWKTKPHGGAESRMMQS